MARKRTTVYLDEEVVALAIARGFNISAVCREALRAAAGKVSKEILQAEIDRLQTQLQALEKAKTETELRQTLLSEFAEQWILRVSKVPLDQEHERFHLNWIEARKHDAGLGYMDGRELFDELEKRRRDIDAGIEVKR